MSKSARVFLHRVHKDRRGQALFFVTLCVPLLFATSALIVDVGLIYYHQSQLTTSTQAAALAGAYAMSASGATTTSVTAVITTYSGTGSNDNAYANLTGVTMPAGYPSFPCLTTLKNLYGTQCFGPGGSNAIVVEQRVSVPLYFFQWFGFKSITLTAMATAAMKGATIGPYNVAIIVDSTASMNDTDSESNCASTRISCALGGIQILLQGLSPCQPTESTCGTATDGNVTNSVDRASLLTFPAVSTATAVNDYTCSRTAPTIEDYATPFPSTSTYQIVDFSSDYKTSDSATSLNASSDIVKAVGGASGCAPMIAKGGTGTFYAQVIYAAQAYLEAEQSSYPTAKNVMILLSDGDANATSAHMPGASTSSGTYISTLKQCHQAITAAQAAAAAGTRVYSVAYGAEASGCTTDTSPSITPCETMQQIASSPEYFFSDYTATGSDSSCISAAEPITGLNQIFSTIIMDLSTVKLISNGTT